MNKDKDSHRIETKVRPPVFQNSNASIYDLNNYIDSKKKPELLWFLEHPPIYTAGTSSIGENIFIFKAYNTLKNTIIEHNDKGISIESDWRPEDKIIKIKIDESLSTLQINKSVKGYEIKGCHLLL